MSEDSTERITGRQFMAAEGASDWRAIWGGGWACACFRVGSFAAGAAFVETIGALALDCGHDPDVDLRTDSVTVRLCTGRGGLSTRDLELARHISAAARELDFASDPSRIQHVQVSIDVTDMAAAQPFWAAVLGYDAIGEEDVEDPLRRGPTFTFQQMDEPRAQRGRMHIDVYLPHDQVEARIAAAVAAGGRVVRDNGPHWWTLADPEGNEVDLAIWGLD